MSERTRSRLRDASSRTGLAIIATAFALAGPGSAIAMGSFGTPGSDDAVLRRLDADDDTIVWLSHDDDEDDATTTAFGATRTRNLDGDSTRGNDGTNGAATATRNADRDDTRGNDGTSDGDDTRGEDGTSDGDDTETGADDTSADV
jgi:hypothetical protein